MKKNKRLPEKYAGFPLYLSNIQQISIPMITNILMSRHIVAIRKKKNFRRSVSKRNDANADEHLQCLYQEYQGYSSPINGDISFIALDEI